MQIKGRKEAWPNNFVKIGQNNAFSVLFLPFFKLFQKFVTYIMSKFKGEILFNIS